MMTIFRNTYMIILVSIMVLASTMKYHILAFNVPLLIQAGIGSRRHNELTTVSTRLYNNNNIISTNSNKQSPERNGNNECNDNMLIRSALTFTADNEWGIPSSSSLPSLVPDNSYNQKKKRPYQLPNGATVTLVGSGPGDPELLTVRTYKLLTEATSNALIIIDRLVSKEIIDLIPKHVSIKIARKLPGCAELAQEEIYWWMYQGLNAGKQVIRLKIGDPFVFGRGSEEILLLRQYGIEAKVIPVSFIYLFLI